MSRRVRASEDGKASPREKIDRIGVQVIELRSWPPSEDEKDEFDQMLKEAEGRTDNPTGSAPHHDEDADPGKSD